MKLDLKLRTVPSVALAVMALIGLIATTACSTTPQNTNGDIDAGLGKKGDVDPAAAIAQARDLIVANRLAEARDVLTRVIDQVPDNATAYELRGIAFMREGKSYPGIRDLNAAADLAPSVKVYFNLGNALQQAGFHERAITAYRAALELSPDDPEVLANLGAAMLYSRRIPEGQQILQRVTRMRPDDPVAYTNLGISYQRQKNWAAAERNFRKALEVDPEYYPAQFNLAKTYDTMGEYDLAAEAYKKYLQMRPDAPDRQKIMNRAGLMPEDLM